MSAGKIIEMYRGVESDGYRHYNHGLYCTKEAAALAFPPPYGLEPLAVKMLDMGDGTYWELSKGGPERVTSDVELLRARALGKLTPEERKVLGVK